MGKRFAMFWDRFVACRLQAHNARNEAERVVWLQVAESWLIMAQGENAFEAQTDLPFNRHKRLRARIRRFNSTTPFCFPLNLGTFGRLKNDADRNGTVVGPFKS